MPAVADQKPTTGTRAIGDAVGDGIGVEDGIVVGSGTGFAGECWMAAVGRLGAAVDDGCVGAHDSTTAASAALIHRRVIQGLARAQRTASHGAGVGLARDETPAGTHQTRRRINPPDRASARPS